MKTVILITDSVLEAAESLASDLSMSRDDFFTKAVADFIELRKYKSTTVKLNSVYSSDDFILHADLGKMQYESQGYEDWNNQA